MRATATIVLALAACTATPSPTPLAPAAISAFAVAGRGAEVSFVEYEAEVSAYKGELIGPTREAKTLAGEASGRLAVTLKGGDDHVTFTPTQPANAITVRYSVPDGTEGMLQAGDIQLPLTSKYSWYYGGFPFTNDPADGLAHHFYDHVRGLFGRTLDAGATVKLTCSCTIDLADFELVAPPLAQPPDSVSVVDFGADPTGTGESAEAFEKALATGRHVWIPAGTFLVPKRIDVGRLSGAGMWHSVLRGNNVGLVASAGTHLADFAIIGEVAERDDQDPANGVGGTPGAGSVIERLFIQHTKVGMWFDGPFSGQAPPRGAETNPDSTTDPEAARRGGAAQHYSLTVRGNRIFDQTADGLNLHRGISNAVVEHNVIRNTGDDGLAMWSDQNPNHHNTFRHNTIQLPMLANGIGIYGGHDNLVSDNVIADILIEGAGIQVANRFSGTVPLEGVTTLERNTVLRGGSRFTGIQAELGAFFLYGKDSPIVATIRLAENSALDSTFSGRHFYAARITGVEVSGLIVERPGTYGVQIQSMGSASITGSRVEKGVYYCEALPFSLTVTESVGLDSTLCE